MVAGISRIAGTAYGMAQQEMFEMVLSAQSGIPNAHLVGKLVAKGAAKAHTALVAGVSGLLRKAGIGKKQSAEMSAEFAVSDIDKKLIEVGVKHTLKMLRSMYAKLGIDADKLPSKDKLRKKLTEMLLGKDSSKDAEHSLAQDRSDLEVFLDATAAEARLLTVAFHAGRLDAGQWHERLHSLLMLGGQQAWLAAGNTSDLSISLMAADESDAAETLAQFTVSTACGRTSVRQSLDAAELLARYPAVLCEQQRRLLAREQGAIWEQRVYFGDTDPECLAYASAGWKTIGSFPAIGDTPIGTRCTCRFNFEMADFETPSVPERFTVTSVAEWTAARDLALFADWDPKKHHFGKGHKFVSNTDWMGEQYEALKASKVAKGEPPPTTEELMAHAGPPVRPEDVVPTAPEGDKPVHPGKNPATRALAEHLQTLASKHIDPSESNPHLFNTLKGHAQEEVEYIHQKLGITIPEGSTGQKTELANQIIAHLQQKAGDTTQANGVASAIKLLTEYAGTASASSLNHIAQVIPKLTAN